MKNVCPCCKRALPAPKGQSAERKALMHDLRLAENAIEALESALLWPNESESFREAVQLERERMTRALNDHTLLWRIYRRNSKTPCYSFERIEVAA
jgi:hypothetical protein